MKGIKKNIEKQCKKSVLSIESESENANLKLYMVNMKYAIEFSTLSIKVTIMTLTGQTLYDI